jgi:hypothetical protein
VADQGPRQGEGGSTRQGIYILTASGQLLAYKNAGQNADVMRQVLRDALAAWKKLPEPERLPGRVTVKEFGPADPRFNPTPPPGTAIVNVYTRILDRRPDGSYQTLPPRCTTQPQPNAAQRDRLWLRGDEVRQFVPAEPRVGRTQAVPAAVAHRLIRFHLVDNTRGEPSFWEKEQVRTARLQFTVTAVHAGHIDLQLDGPVLLTTAADPEKANRGFDAHVRGWVRVERATGKLTRFDVVALGEHWGECTYTPGARLGRTPLGIAMCVCAGTTAVEQIPPQGFKSGDYFSANQ